MRTRAEHAILIIDSDRDNSRESAHAADLTFCKIKRTNCLRGGKENPVPRAVERKGHPSVDMCSVRTLGVRIV